MLLRMVTGPAGRASRLRAVRRASRWLVVGLLGTVAFALFAWLTMFLPRAAPAVLVVLFVMGLVADARRRRPYLRRLRGQCAGCGYDMRATPDRCPECGAPASA